MSCHCVLAGQRQSTRKLPTTDCWQKTSESSGPYSPPAFSSVVLPGLQMQDLWCTCVHWGWALHSPSLYCSSCGFLWRSLPRREFDEGWELHLFRKGGSCPKSHLLTLRVCAYMTCVWECGYAWAMACMWRSGYNFGSRFSFPLWAPGTEFRFLDLCGPCHTNILMILSNIFFQFLKYVCGF